MRTPRALTALTALVIMATTLAACSSDTTSNQATKGDRTVTVTMTDNAYAPKNISAKAGESVTFKFVNDGQMTHEAYIGSDISRAVRTRHECQGGRHHQVTWSKPSHRRARVQASCPARECHRMARTDPIGDRTLKSFDGRTLGQPVTSKHFCDCVDVTLVNGLPTVRNVLHRHRVARSVRSSSTPSHISLVSER